MLNRESRSSMVLLLVTVMEVQKSCKNEVVSFQGLGVRTM